MADDNERSTTGAEPSERLRGGSTRRTFLRATGASAAALGLGSAAGTAGAQSAGIPTPRLHTEGKWVKDPEGNRVKLRGVSIADPQWVNENAVWLGMNAQEAIDLATDAERGWYANHVRLPVTQDSIEAAGGYQAYIDEHLRPAVDFLGERGIYAVVDNHIIRPYTEEATDEADDDYEQYPDELVREFWDAMAPEFADDEHVIYELYNEPTAPYGNGLEDWNRWRDAAQPWVDHVREYAPETPIVVGSPMWCQMTNHAHENPFYQDNILYAAHIYTQEYMRPWDEYFGDTVDMLPLFNTEWGWDATSDVHVDQDTRSNYGEPMREWTEAHDNVHWTAWCFDPEWGPVMFEGGEDSWDLLGGEDHHGEFVKTWLEETKDDLVPQVEAGQGGGEDPVDNTQPDSPPNLAVDRAAEVALEVSWDEPSTVGPSGLSHYVVYFEGERYDRVSKLVTSAAFDDLEPGTGYEIQVTAVDGAGNESEPTTITAETIEYGSAQSPYDGPNVLPGRVEAEDFDEGGSGIAYSGYGDGDAYRDVEVGIEQRTEGSYNIGWVGAGDWWEYTVQPEASGTYAMHVRFSCGNNQGGSVRVEVDREEVATNDVWPTGDWENWQTARIGEVDLSAGEHVVRVVAEEGGFNFDWIEFEGQDLDYSGPAAPADLSAPTATPTSVDLEWTAPDGDVAGYEVYVDGDLDHEVSADAASTTVSGLEPATDYEFGVAAVDADGDASPPATVEAATEDGDGGPTLSIDLAQSRVAPDGTADATLTLSRAPNGLAGYTVTVQVDDASVATITDAEYADAFSLDESAEYADDGSAVTLKAVDLNDEIQPGAEDVELATVTLAAESAGDTEIGAVVEMMDSDDDGSDVDPVVAGGTLTVRELRLDPIEGSVPQDVDGDGVHEDVNASGDFDSDDVVLFFEYLDEPEMTAHPDAYDVNGSGELDFDDVITLFDEL